MRCSLKELAIGVGLALVVFLAWLGIEITPVILIGGLVLLFKFTMDNRTNSRFTLVEQKRAGAGVIPDVDFSDIGGQEVAKREFKEALDFIRLDQDVRRLGIRPLKGILLVGPPGTGKTLMAKAAAGYTNSVFIAAAGSQFVEMYAGVGAQRVRRLFSQAYAEAEKANKQTAIVFIDEIDVLGAKRGKNSGHMEYDQTLNELLTQIDGITVNQQVRLLVVGATNRVDLLDPALLRPGRFDRIVRVDLPDKQGRLQILKIHAKDKPLAADVDLDKIAQATFGFSGAHLESVMNEAAIYALRHKRHEITNQDLKEALEKVMLGEKLNRSPSDEERLRVAYHETGHALISEKVCAGSVASVSIISRGGALGYMRQHGRDDQYLYTKAELLDRIQLCMAGAVAEELAFGERSTGAAGDVEQAAKIAKQIVFAGLSDLGVVTQDLPGGILARTIAQIIKEQERQVYDYLAKNKSRMDLAARKLLEEETLSGDQFRRIMAQCA
ncbi:MAG: AAA family ATPase [Limnochordia bacterium]|jgi:ATP-dependent metalloprotease FtsH|nr:AAA family ATPase [Bacillota bacterium]HOB07862.1 AAA family ATPase [Limnochordia bacterium]HPT93229.1 AAA family ATPase [Limnochordia bacterium]HQD70319.1 AAA family ATPase [Limnochordia bacterium]HXK96245.1 AAA family ATPase [Limnochordia bacterium]